MPALTGPVGKHTALQHQGLQRMRHQHGGGGDEAIHQHHPAFAGRLQHHTHQSRHLEPTECSQRVQRRSGLRMQGQHLAQNDRLAQHGSVVEPGACPGAVGNGQTGQPRQQHRRHRGVANTHLAQQHHIARQAAHQVLAVGDGLLALHHAHGGPGRRIGRALRQLAHHQARARGKVVPHTTVHHRQSQPVLARQHTHRRATGQEVLHHLPGHITRVRRHAPCGQPMVGGTDQHLRLHEMGLVGAEDQTQLQGQWLQPPKGAEWFCFGVQLVLESLRQGGVTDVSNVKSGESLRGHSSWETQKKRHTG